MSKAQLERGYRLVELLKQPLNSPMPVEEQVVSIFAGTRGYLDDVPVGDVRRFERELLELLPRHATASLLDEIRTAACPTTLGDAIDAFKAQFQRSRPATAVRPTRTATDAERARRGREQQDPRAGRRHAPTE